MSDTSGRKALDFLNRVMASDGIESASGIEAFLPVSGVAMADERIVKSAADKLLRRVPLDPADQFALEAIIIPEKRPAILIQDGDYTIIHKDWLQFNNEPIRTSIKAAIASVGRVELPDHPQIPYGGTAFVVGNGILMTNRHVAEIFNSGLGRRNLHFIAGQSAGVDFGQEYNGPPPQMLRVSRVLMVHPYWDMALLAIDGLPANHPALTLSIGNPEAQIGREVAVIGYPAFDARNDPRVQDKVFAGVYNVKRLQPGIVGAGKGRARCDMQSFGKTVSALMHDASTLGGNSGSVAFDPATGQVVGLHFAGIYLDANYAVPAADLARDGRVVDAGVNFATGSRPDPDTYAAWWLRTEDREPAQPVGDGEPPNAGGPPPRNDVPPATTPDGSVNFTIPLQITVRLGAATTADITSPTPPAETEKMAEPIHDEDYASRAGYDSYFLGLPLPLPTPADRQSVSLLEDGSHVIPYHHFSVVMHRHRRLALFTASNVDMSQAARAPDPTSRYTRASLTGLGKSDIERWFTDPRIPALHQLPDRFFTKDGGAFDKGHLVRRDDVAWGSSFAGIQLANGDTYHVTNCSPQVAKLNRPDQQDNWGELESFVAREAGQDRLTLFAGPVLADDDRTFSGYDNTGRTRVLIPSRFWKIVAAATGGTLQSFGFLLTQDLSQVPLEFAVSDKWRRHMVPIVELEQIVGLVCFPDEIKRADAASESTGGRIRAQGGIELLVAPTRRGPVTPQQKRPRTAADLRRGPLTFRDPRVSLFQSVAEAVASKSAILPPQDATTEALAGDPAADIILAAEAVAANAMTGSVAAAAAGAEELPVRAYAAECVSLAWHLMTTKWSGNTAAVEEVESHLNSGICDPNWSQTITEYYRAYGAFGDVGARRYVTPAEVGNTVIPIHGGVRIALIGDWGTGALPARRVLECVRDQRPDILIHLGDIYYSGTSEECHGKFTTLIDSVFDRASNPLPVYSLCGNHDMYCGGVGYYDLIGQLNQGPLAQHASFFCLRADDNAWQILAMDTGRNDYSPFSVSDIVTYIELEEQAWLCDRVREFNGKTILLSHHQLFSAFSTIGGQHLDGTYDPVNPNLERTWRALRTAAVGKIPVWFWGHEHNQCIYESYRTLPLGRCIGHGAIPVPAEEHPYDVPAALARPPSIVPGTELSVADGYYTNGFAMLTLGASGVLAVDYFENLNGQARLVHHEDIA